MIGLFCGVSMVGLRWIGAICAVVMAARRGVGAEWDGYAGDAPQLALAGIGGGVADRLLGVRWETPVDLMPQYVGSG